MIILIIILLALLVWLVVWLMAGGAVVLVALVASIFGAGKGAVQGVQAARSADIKRAKSPRQLRMEADIERMKAERAVKKAARRAKKEQRRG